MLRLPLRISTNADELCRARWLFLAHGTTSLGSVHPAAHDREARLAARPWRVPRVTGDVLSAQRRIRILLADQVAELLKTVVVDARSGQTTRMNVRRNRGSTGWPRHTGSITPLMQHERTGRSARSCGRAPPDFFRAPGLMCSCLAAKHSRPPARPGRERPARLSLALERLVVGFPGLTRPVARRQDLKGRSRDDRRGRHATEPGGARSGPRPTDLHLVRIPQAPR